MQLKRLPIASDIVFDMKTISLSVSEKDYELFRDEAKRQQRSIASLIREAMAVHLAMGPVRAGAGDAEGPSLAGLESEVIKQVTRKGPGRYEIIAEVRELD